MSETTARTLAEIVAEGRRLEAERDTPRRRGLRGCFVADHADARREAEEALRRVLANAATIVRLSWSDGATAADRANLERIKSAAADIAQDHKILRASIAALSQPAPMTEVLASRAERLEKALREIESKTGHFGEAPPPPEWMPMLSLIAWVGRISRAALGEEGK